MLNLLTLFTSNINFGIKYMTCDRVKDKYIENRRMCHMNSLNDFKRSIKRFHVRKRMGKSMFGIKNSPL